MILNLLPLSPLLCTSGQPSAKELESIAQEGYEVVINLALSDADNALEHEDVIIKSLGMGYIHLPVRFDAPRVEDFWMFERIVESLEGRKIWVHCAKNYRVSAFFHLYALLHPQSFTPPQGLVKRFWEPNATWNEWMRQVLQSFPAQGFNKES